MAYLENGAVLGSAPQKGSARSCKASSGCLLVFLPLREGEKGIL